MIIIRTKIRIWYCLICILAISISLFSSPAFARKYIELKYQPETLKSDEKRLIKRLRKILLKNFDYETSEEHKRIYFDYTIIDLNKDGEKEFLVYSYWSYFCGSSGDCQASVYHRQPSGWRYAGAIALYFDSLYVEDRYSNNWPVTHSKEYRNCWTDDPRLSGLYKRDDILGFPHTHGDPGYFLRVSIYRDCPNTARITMRAQLELNRVSGADLVVDGSYGPKTRHALDSLTPEQWKEFRGNLRIQQREIGERQ